MSTDYLEQARALGPVIAPRTAETDQTRRLPDDIVGLLADSGMFRMLLPRSFGGGELSPTIFVQVLEELAKADASVAWVVGQTSGCSMSAAYLDPKVARQVFQPRQGPNLAWGPPAGSRAVACDGGYRVSGRWNFASGSRHTAWLGGACPTYEANGSPRLAEDGSHVEVTLVLPAGEVTMHDVWDVIGLRGTGSDSFTLTDAFIPHERAFARDTQEARRESGPLYLFTTHGMFSAGFAGVALGIARAQLDAFIQLALDKTGRAARQSLRENSAVHNRIGEAEGRLRAARAFLLTSVSEAWHSAQHSGHIEVGQRVGIRLASSHAIREAREVVNMAYHAAGSTAIFGSSLFERRFRDMHTLAQQIQGRDDHFENVGRFMLGVGPDPSFL